MSALPWIAVLLFAAAACGFAALAADRVAEDLAAGRGAKGFVGRWLEARRRAKFDDQLPEALATMSNALRAGFSISQAFDSVVELELEPVSSEFSILQRQLRIGMSMEDALESMAERSGSEDFSLVTIAILASRRTGGNITEIFEKISETIRERKKIERKVKTLTAQGRMQGALVSAMPVVLGGAMTMLRPDMMIPFFCSMEGAAAIVATLVLTAAGWFLIGKTTKIDI